jgi:hypothetical protein
MNHTNLTTRMYTEINHNDLKKDKLKLEQRSVCRYIIIKIGSLVTESHCLDTIRIECLRLSLSISLIIIECILVSPFISFSDSFFFLSFPFLFHSLLDNSLCSSILRASFVPPPLIAREKWKLIFRVKKNPNFLATFDYLKLYW